MLRLFLRLALACLVSMSLVLPAWAQQRVWVVLSEEAGAYAEAAQVIREALSEAQLSVGLWSQLTTSGDPPALVIPIGHVALETSLRGLTEKAGSWERVPVLATLLPRSAYDATLAKGLANRRLVSAVVLDQPLSRQLALLKLALPERRRVGVLVGPLVRPLLPQLEKEARSRDQQVLPTQIVERPEQLYPALKEALESADVLLALPEPGIYNSTTLQNILLATYRARVPMVAFSAAYVKAGALLAVYATPAQVARQAATMARGWLAGRYGSISGSGTGIPGAPPVQFSREFSVVTNPHVAASLGLRIDDAEYLAAELRRREGSP